jgi:hypothetical protein
MKFKKFMIILALFMVLLCCFSAASASENVDESVAVSDDITIDNVVSEVDYNDELTAGNDIKQIETMDESDEESVEVQNNGEIESDDFNSDLGDIEDSKSTLSVKENDPTVIGDPYDESDINDEDYGDDYENDINDEDYGDDYENDIDDEDYDDDYEDDIDDEDYDDEEINYNTLTKSDFDIEDYLLCENAKEGYKNGDAINIYCDLTKGKFYAYVNNALKYRLSSTYGCSFTLKNLGITKSGKYHVVIKYISPTNKKITILNKNYKVYFKETITLTLKTVKVKKSAKKLVLKATLKINKKPVRGKKITFKFNGKKYVSKTNKKGVATVTINKKILKKLKVGKKVKYQASYKKKTVKKSVKVKK